jgi:hypothetical protein
LSDWKKTLVPQLPQNDRLVPGEDSCVFSAPAPSVTRICPDGNPAQVTNAAPCARRQLAQWQCATKRDGKRATNRTAPQWQLPLASPITP